MVADDGDIRAFENPGYEFERSESALRADGAIWDPVTGRSDDARRLAPIPSRRLFAVAWRDAHCDAFYSAASSTS